MAEGNPFIPVHGIVPHLGQLTSTALSHALPWCDTTSAISDKRKISFWDTWKLVPEITPIFAKLSNATVPEETTEADCNLTKKFFIVLYSATNKTNDINSARWMLSTHGERSVENMSTTRKALKQKIIRAALQASIWNDCLKKQRTYRNPTECDWWKFDEEYIPFWSDLPDEAKSWRELIKCSCKKSCKDR